MSRHAVLIASQHGDIEAWRARFKEGQGRIQDRLDFLKRQVDQVHKESEAACRSLWAEMEEFLADQNLLPKGYDPKTWYLEFDKSGVLYAGLIADKENERNPVEAFFLNLLR